jgi:hypothetical protein
MAQAELAKLDPTRDRALSEPPVGVAMYAENYMLSAFDPAADLGMWLHLGTWPEDFALWEDFAIVSLPDDVLWMSAYHRTDPADRPGGSNLHFRCIEPFRRWKVTFDGIVCRTPRAEMLGGRLRDGARERMLLDLDLECVTPIWDAQESASSAHGTGSMEDQVWGREHYQQLYLMTGTAQLHTEGELRIDTSGVRDHSRGPRGHAMDKWGGHTLIHVLFPSGRAFGVQTMWLPTGEVSLDTAYVLVDGEMHHAAGVELPRLERLGLGGEEMALTLRSELGDHHLTGTEIRTTFVTPQRLGMAFGADRAGAHGILGFGHARWVWDGEVGYGLTERSNVNLPAPDAAG